MLQDNGGTALGGVDTSAPQTFTITVTAVNDAPSFAVGANQTVLENAGPQTVAAWAARSARDQPNESGQTLHVHDHRQHEPGALQRGPGSCRRRAR